MRAFHVERNLTPSKALRLYNPHLILPALGDKPLFSMESGGIYAIPVDKHGAIGNFVRMDSLRHKFKGRARKKARIEMRKRRKELESTQRTNG